MEVSAALHIGANQLTFDRANQFIVSGDKKIQLSPKAFAVLELLWSRAGELVSKNEMLDAVWPDVCVVDAVLKNTVRELRKALGDCPRSPRFIETVHRRGYRFVGKRLLSTTKGAMSMPVDRGPVPDESEVALVGRQREYQRLSELWSEAQQGSRRAVLLNGDPGIGKSTLVRKWYEDQRHQGDCVALRAKCTRAMSKQPYLVFLNALLRASKQLEGVELTDLLARHAPSWLARLPMSSASLPPGMPGSMADLEHLFLEAETFLEALSGQRTVLLLIEDLHWCDRQTLKFLDYLCHREEPARMMILVTCCGWSRRARAIVDSCSRLDEPTRQHISLAYLDETEVGAYLQALVGRSMPRELVSLLHRRSCGHPLYLKSVVEDLIGGEGGGGIVLQGTGVLSDRIGRKAPGMFQRRLEIEKKQLDAPAQRLLQAASVVVVEAFSAAALAALLGRDIMAVEDQCEELAERARWIRRLGSREWPDGTLAELYGFHHPIYRDSIYETVPAGRRRWFHLRHAQRLEVAYEGHLSVVAPNLAYHFKCGGDVRRARTYAERSAQSNAAHHLPISCDLAPNYHRYSSPFSSGDGTARRGDGLVR